jgi:hypothetical protein
VLIGMYFGAPALSPTPFETAYQQMVFRSNLYRQDVAQ